MSAEELAVAQNAGVGYSQAVLAYARARNVVLPSEYYGKLVGVQRSKAVTVAGLGSLEQVRFVIDQLNATLQAGGTFAEFKKRVRSGAVAVNLPDYRLDNIYRTNVQAAYAHGRWQSQQRGTRRTYLMYDAINDSRTRPTHLAMDNVVLPRDHPWWRTHYPPNGYRCRCTVISLTEAQARARGITTDLPTEQAARPDKGWDYHVGEDYTALDAPLLRAAVVNAEVTTRAASAQIAVAQARVQQQLEEAAVDLQALRRAGLTSVADLSDEQLQKKVQAIPAEHPLRKLSITQLRVLYAYTTGDFSKVNEMLRNPAGWVRDPVARQVVRSLLTLVRNASIIAADVPVKAKTLYRGVNLKKMERSLGAEFTESFVRAHMDVGAVIENRAFTSTSATQHIAAGTAGSLRRLEIELEADTATGIDIAPISLYPEEAEVLLQPGTRYRVAQVLVDTPELLRVRVKVLDYAADVKPRHVFGYEPGVAPNVLQAAADSADRLSDKFVAQVSHAAVAQPLKAWAALLNMQ